MQTFEIYNCIDLQKCFVLTSLSATINDKKHVMAGSQLAEVLHLLFREQKYDRSCSCSSDRQSSEQLSPVDECTCRFAPPQVAISKPFPPEPCLFSIRRPTCSARGAIRGLTLRRQRLLLTDRLFPRRSSHLKYFPGIASCHAPLVRTRESLLEPQKICWP